MRYALVFYLDNTRIAFDLEHVIRVIWAAEITCLPNAQPNISGAIDVQGEIISVINTRMLLGYSPQEMKLSDQFVICHAKKNKIAFWVDKTGGVIQLDSSELIPLSHPDSATARYVIKDKEGMIPLYTPEELLESPQNTHLNSN